MYAPGYVPEEAMSKQIKAFAGSAPLPYCGQLSHTSHLTRQPFLTTLQADHVILRAVLPYLGAGAGILAKH